MGAEVHCNSHETEYYSMMDINEDSNSSSWSLFYGDKTLSNGQYHNAFVPRVFTDGYRGYEKDMLKQKMLEQEAIFKNQVYELHRLYRVQRDMMEEIKRNELYKHMISIEASSSSSRLASQIPSDETRTWHIPSFPLANSSCVRQSILNSNVADSPLSCTKGKNSTQNGQVPSQNIHNSKDFGLSESRPSKVKKKLFNLELPADEYIDTDEGEQIQETKISEVSSYHPSGDHRVAHENNRKLFFGGEKTDFHRHNPSVSRLKSSIGLADLNEPIQVEEASAPKSVDFLARSARYGELRSQNSCAKPKPQFVDLSEDFSQNSHHASTDENLKNFSAANKGNKTGWLSHMYEAGNNGRDRSRIPKSIQQEQSPFPYCQTEVMLNKAHQPPHVLQTDFRREDLWTERNHTYDISGRSHDYFNYNQTDSVVASRISNPCSFVNSSGVTNSLSHSVASWGNPNSKLTQKLTVHTSPSFMSYETFSRNSHTSAQSQMISGEKWHGNGIYRSKPAFESDLPIRNGCYHGSSSSTKEPSFHLSSVGYNSVNCNKAEVLASECLINNHGCKNVIKSPDAMDLKSGKDFNLNSILPRNSFIDAVSSESPEIVNGKKKHEDKPAMLPWLKEKPVCKNAVSVTRNEENLEKLSFLQTSCNQWVKNETGKDSNPFYTQNVSSASNGLNVGTKRESGDCLSNGKIPGFPIFGKLCMSKNDSSSLVCTSESVHLPSKDEGGKSEKKHRGIDINVACSLMDADSDELISAEALVLQNGVDTKVKNFRNFDLNSCLSEDEDRLGSSVASTNVNEKIIFEIDLEAPVLETEEAFFPGEEQNQCELTKKPQNEEQDEVKVAAEAIVAISLYDQDHHMECTPFKTSEASVSHSLLWFAEAISSSAEDEGKISSGSRCRVAVDIEELDYFEAMTLQLTETKQEEYMPNPFVPETQKAEEAGTISLPSRTRKSLARRGRQRRDFQRDILPGLVSLSRHEVTEDIQTFGSLMRATGHQWNGGLTRRNGTRSATRGRRRRVVSPAVTVTPVSTPLIQHVSNIEIGLEDRSLTGWGKTTRRPRRQRCPASINLAVALA